MIEYLIRTYHISAINIGHRKVNNIAGAIYEKLGFKSETKTEFRRTLIIEPKITTISMTTIEYWQTAFQNWERDNDEENYIIKLGTIPVGWISFNGLKSNDIGWIKMVVISSNYHHRGIGTYAVKYALDYFKSKGFNKVGIYTTEDNKSAHRCYIKCRFIVTEYGDCTTSDGKNRKGYTFEKKI